MIAVVIGIFMLIGTGIGIRFAIKDLPLPSKLYLGSGFRLRM